MEDQKYCGIYIEGLTKPDSCLSCRFNDSDCFCSITKGEIDRDDYSNNKECPIKEVYLRNKI